MSLCVECLMRERPDWLSRYRRGWIALPLYGEGSSCSLTALPRS